MIESIGNYELIEPIGKGAMGVVYKARQRSMDRMVALKILPKHLAKDERFVTKFIDEARNAGRCVHPNLLQVYEVGQDGEYWFFSMEYIDGVNLKEFCRHHGPLDVPTTIVCMKKIASALYAAHQQGIIHRDVKPSNILVNTDGEPKLADLGLAKVTEGPSKGESEKNQVGTPYYMSPEQILKKEIDPRADLYSLATTFQHLLTGKPLFYNKDLREVMKGHLKTLPPPLREQLPEAPRMLEQLFWAMLSKNPENRPASANKVVHILKELENNNFTDPFVDVPEESKTKRKKGIKKSSTQSKRNKSTRRPVAAPKKDNSALILMMVLVALIIIIIGIVATR